MGLHTKHPSSTSIQRNYQYLSCLIVSWVTLASVSQKTPPKQAVKAQPRSWYYFPKKSSLCRPLTPLTGILESCLEFLRLHFSTPFTQNRQASIRCGMSSSQDSTIVDWEAVAIITLDRGQRRGEDLGVLRQIERPETDHKAAGRVI